MLQVVLVYIFIKWNNFFFCFQNCCKVQNWLTKYRNTNACTTRHINKICFLFLEKVFSPKSSFPLFRFFSCLTVVQYFDQQKNFKYIPVIFQHLSLTYSIPLVKDRSTLYEFRSRDICMNIKAFIRVNKK